MTEPKPWAWAVTDVETGQRWIYGNECDAKTHAARLMLEDIEHDVRPLGPVETCSSCKNAVYQGPAEASMRCQETGKMTSAERRCKNYVYRNTQMALSRVRSTLVMILSEDG